MARLICPDLFPRFSSSIVCPSAVGYRPGLTLKNAMACYWKAKKWGITYNGSFAGTSATISGHQEILAGIRKTAFDFNGVPFDAGQFFQQGQPPQKVQQLVCYPGKPKPPETGDIYIKDAEGNYPPLPEWGPYREGIEQDDLGNTYELRQYFPNDFQFVDQSPRPNQPSADFVSLTIRSSFYAGSTEYKGLFYNGPFIDLVYAGGVGRVNNTLGNYENPTESVAGEIIIQIGGAEIGRSNLYNFGTTPGSLTITLNSIESFAY